MKVHLRFLVSLVLFTGLLVQNGNAAKRYSVAIGNWNATSTWSATSGGSSGASVPTTGDTVYIEGGFTVTVNANTAALNSLIINAGSTLSTTVGFNLSATTITVNGTYINGSTGTITGTMTVGNVGTFRHNINGGTLKAATWVAGSTCLVTGVTSSSLTVTGHSFSNFTWNSVHTNAVSLSPTAISGNLSIISGGTGTVRINTTPFTIGVNLSLSGTANFQIASSSTAKTLTVNGNFSMSGGTCTFSNGSGIGTLNVKGNFSHTGGTITELSTGSGTIVFNGTSSQTFTSGGTVSNTINYTVNSGAILQMADASTVVTGNAFALVSGATLGIKSTAGITSSGTTGHIQTTTRTFNTGANYIYNGSSAQLTGNGLTTVNNLTTNNSAGVTASGNLTVNGILNLQSANASATQGCLEMSTYTLNMGENATTIGVGDVTGLVVRTSTFVANKPYTFGNQFTFITFAPGGTFPTQLQLKTIIGTAPSWKPGAVKRINDYIRVGGSGFYFTFTCHYLDSELNGNDEEKIVRWKLIPPSTVTEVGRTDHSSIDNWVANANISIANLPTVFGSERSLANSELVSLIWNGSVNNLWATQENWTPRSSPSNVSNIIIPDASTTPNDPTLPSTTEIKSLTINAGGILNSVAGAQLTINGANESWNNIGGVFNAGSGTVIFTNAAAYISGVTDFFNVTINSGAKLTMGSDVTMRIGGTMTNNGTWDVTTFVHNVIEYNGGDQTVLNPNGVISGYHTLILSGSGTKTMPGTALNLQEDFSISGPTTVTAAAPIILAGNLTIGIGSTFNTGSYSHTIGGNFTNSGTFNTTGSTITMNGTSAQTISGSTTTFNNLIISNPVSVTLGVNTEINGDLNITSGNVFDIGAFTCNRSTTGGTLTISGTLKLGGNSGGQTGSNFPLNFGTLTMTGGTVEYYGNNQTVYTGTTYNSMIIGGNGTIILPGSDMTLEDLTMNNSNGVSLMGNITVNRALYLTNGLLILGTKNLTLGSTATVIGTPSATNMIVSTGTGELRKVFAGTGSFTYPVGSNSVTADYSPVTLNFTSGTFSSAYVGVNLSKQKHPNNTSTTSYLNRYWTVTQSGISNFSCGVTLQYLAADVVGNETDIWCGKYDGSIWTLLSAANTETNELSGTVTSFSAFTGGEQGVLPVTLSSLSSAVNGRNIKLNWLTASEQNNSGFEVERAVVNKEAPAYTKTGFVKGKGTTNTATSYSYEDKNLNTGKYKYRLKQIDVNGNFTYFNLNGEVEIGVPGKYDLSQNYPNPFNPTTKINFDLPFDSKVKMIIYDVTGREIKTLVNEVRTAGYHTIVYDASVHSSGIYFYRIIANANGKDYISTKKMALIK